MNTKTKVVAWRIIGVRDQGNGDWVDGAPDEWMVASVKQKGWTIQYAYGLENDVPDVSYHYQLLIDSINEAAMKAGAISAPIGAGPMLLMILDDMANATNQIHDELHGKNGWYANVNELLDNCPYTIRSTFEGPPVISSLVLTFNRMQKLLKDSK